MADRGLDAPSLATGLLALVFAGLVLLDRAGATIDGAAAAAAVVVAVGLAGLVRATAGLRSGGPGTAARNEPPTPGTEQR